MLPWLPRIPGAQTPANQAGTYAFSLRRELQSVFTAGREEGGGLVLAHLDYLHQARYPGYSELQPQEQWRVLRAPLRAIRDLSLHWEYPAVPGEPLNVYSWKLVNVQRTLVAVAEETGFLAPSRRNAFVFFSDHGDRTGLSPDGFGDEALYGVPLATFGVAARDPAKPISLVDIGALIGLPPSGATSAAEPLVEYTNVTGREWGLLMGRSRPRADGGVTLDSEIVAEMGTRMKAFRPYTLPADYSPAPSAVSAP
jgi:hypothetical protein